MKLGFLAAAANATRCNKQTVFRSWAIKWQIAIDFQILILMGLFSKIIRLPGFEKNEHIHRCDSDGWWKMFQTAIAVFFNE
jgi:hypothetical protein